MSDAPGGYLSAHAVDIRTAPRASLDAARVPIVGRALSMHEFPLTGSRMAQVSTFSGTRAFGTAKHMWLVVAADLVDERMG